VGKKQWLSLPEIALATLETTKSISIGFRLAATKTHIKRYKKGERRKELFKMFQRRGSGGRREEEAKWVGKGIKKKTAFVGGANGRRQQEEQEKRRTGFTRGGD